MPITYELIKQVTSSLYDRSLRGIPADTKAALRRADAVESNETARHTLRIMLESADAAERKNHFVCSDAGVPVFFVRVGTQAQFSGDVRRAITDGFAELVESIQPPLLPHVTHPLTLERGYQGKGMPIVTFDLVDGCRSCGHHLFAQGARLRPLGRARDLQLPGPEDDRDLRARDGDQGRLAAVPAGRDRRGHRRHFRLRRQDGQGATLRPIGQSHPEPIVADMERRLVDAVNQTGFGPMGTGGDSTAMAVHVDYCAGHGFTPVAVAFNCWINRRTRARVYNDGRVEIVE